MKSPLINETLEAQLKTLLERLTDGVELTCIAGDGAKDEEMTAFLQHFASLSPKLTCRILKAGESPELDEALDASLLPATGVALPGEMPRMVFHGIPGGKEITAFASAVLTAGGGMKPLDKPTLKDIAKVKNPMVLQICVSLGCQHCSQLVSSAHRVAWENPLITAHMIDANLYPALVKEYDIQRVPLTVIDRKRIVPGGKTMAELTSLLARYK
jgi:thioredoxin reductase (NADPH)